MGVKNMPFKREDLEALCDAKLVFRGDREIGAGTYTDLGYVGEEVLKICKSIIWQYQNVHTISKKQRKTLLEFQYYNDPDSDWEPPIYGYGYGDGGYELVGGMWEYGFDPIF